MCVWDFMRADIWHDLASHRVRIYLRTKMCVCVCVWKLKRRKSSTEDGDVILSARKMFQFILPSFRQLFIVFHHFGQMFYN